jgi:hypothetical protein
VVDDLIDQHLPGYLGVASYGFAILLRPLIRGYRRRRHRSWLLVCPAGLDPRLSGPDLLLRWRMNALDREHGVDEE